MPVHLDARCSQTVDELRKVYVEHLGTKNVSASAVVRRAVALLYSQLCDTGELSPQAEAIEMEKYRLFQHTPHTKGK